MYGLCRYRYRLQLGTLIRSTWSGVNTPNRSSLITSPGGSGLRRLPQTNTRAGAYIPALGGMIINAALENTLARVKPPAFEGYYSVKGKTLDTTVVSRMSAITEALGEGQPPGFR